ncbi:hypothetical protein GcM3_04987 [Golovinomyces cichoracearum]|uniref:Uncharacterized protein n=1 Tax=Golovinomyces cichoracearum TaxID=62708 RepID=A0A420H9C6_9PEZI|nr:hypothetical protein GcM3_04987 [Golovinomyces cichoracearum]
MRYRGRESILTLLSVVTPKIQTCVGNYFGIYDRSIQVFPAVNFVSLFDLVIDGFYRGIRSSEKQSPILASDKAVISIRLSYTIGILIDHTPIF